MKGISIKLLLIGALVVFLLGGLVVELPFSMNYLQARSFWKGSIMAGIILGLAVGGITLWRRWSQLRDVVAKMQLFFALFITVCVSTPLILSWVNRIGVGEASAEPTAIILESQQARFSSRFGSSRLQKPQANQYLLFFYREGQLYRIQDDQPFFSDAETGDTLTVDIAMGRLGYEWVVRPQ